MATINRGISMVISPAKTLDLKKLSERRDEMELDYDTIVTMSAAASAHTKSLLCDQDKTRAIVNIMKKKSEAELKTLLSLSPSLAKTAHEYWSNFSLESSDNNNIKKKNDHFAIFTFNGPAFQGVAAHTCDESTLSYMSQNLFILDPVYGVLRSLDTMQPYRLEMGVKGIVSNNNSNDKQQGRKETLASYWKDSVTSYLGKEMNYNKSSSAPSILANLASDEYSSSIDVSSLPSNTIYLNIIFRHQGRVLSVHAKRARGLMARYLSQTNSQTLDDVAKFNLENYNCIPNEKDEKWTVIDIVGDNVQIMKMIFDRNEAPPKKKMVGGKRTAATELTKQGGKKEKKKK